MNPKLKAYIIQKLRQISYTTINQEREEAKRLHRIGPSLWKCDACGIKLYGGDSQKNYDNWCEQYGKNGVIWQSPQWDHIVPVSDPKTGWVNWDRLVETMFCNRENYSPKCKSCHHKKTQEENQERKKLTKAKKPDKIKKSKENT